MKITVTFELEVSPSCLIQASDSHIGLLPDMPSIHQLTQLAFEQLAEQQPAFTADYQSWQLAGEAIREGNDLAAYDIREIGARWGIDSEEYIRACLAGREYRRKLR